MITYQNISFSSRNYKIMLVRLYAFLPCVLYLIIVNRTKTLIGIDACYKEINHYEVYSVCPLVKY